MLYTERAARENLRVREGKRVFYLGEDDRLTPSARDFLRAEGVPILPKSEAKPKEYRTEQGAVLAHKPERMTHLSGNVLVEKTDPRIAFRGKIDTLEAQILLDQCQTQDAALVEFLAQVLEFLRRLLRAEVLGEPVPKMNIAGLSEEAARERSHDPAKFYNQAHFMPAHTDGDALLRLNLLRARVREAELAACHAFGNDETRQDVILALNRLSSAIYVEMICRRANS